MKGVLIYMMSKGPIQQGLKAAALAVGLAAVAATPAQAKERARVVDVRNAVVTGATDGPEAVSAPTDDDLSEEDLFALVEAGVNFDPMFKVKKAKRGLTISGGFGDIATVTWNLGADVLFNIAGENGEPFEKVTLGNLKKVLRYVVVRDEVYMAGAKRRMKVTESMEGLYFELLPKDSAAQIRVRVNESDFVVGLFKDGKPADLQKAVKRLKEIEELLDSGGGATLRNEEHVSIEGTMIGSTVTWVVTKTIRNGRKETVIVTTIAGGQPDKSGALPKIVGGRVTKTRTIIKEAGRVTSDTTEKVSGELASN
jgi:hypothetical protein